MLDGDNFTRDRFVDKQRAFFLSIALPTGPILKAVDGKFTEQFSGHMHDYAQTQLLCNELQPSSNKFKPTRVRPRGSGAENILPTVKRQFET